jgi:hypothetical protein
METIEIRRDIPQIHGYAYRSYTSSFKTRNPCSTILKSVVCDIGTWKLSNFLKLKGTSRGRCAGTHSKLILPTEQHKYRQTIPIIELTVDAEENSRNDSKM